MTENDKDDAANSLWERIRRKLAENGVYLGVSSGRGLEGLDDVLDNLMVDLGEAADGIKVVCVSPDLKAHAEEMSETQRDQVVMVRVDEETRDRLDDWVKTGAVKSRSEAAALFIREGLGVRADELERLREALHEVEEAQARLHKKASEIFDASAAG